MCHLWGFYEKMDRVITAPHFTCFSAERKNSKNPVEFREMVLRRQHRQMSLDPVTPTRFPAPPPELSSSGEDSDLSAAMMGKLWLPKLPERKLMVNMSSSRKSFDSTKTDEENDWGWWPLCYLGHWSQWSWSFINSKLKRSCRSGGSRPAVASPMR